VLKLLVAFLCAFCCFCSTAWAQNGPRYPFSVTPEPSGGGHSIIARNEGPVPVSVRIALEGAEKVSVDHAMPLYAVIPARGVMQLAHTKPAPGERGYSLRIQSKWSVGNYLANPSPNELYRLPFRDGQIFRIGQSPGGPISTHTTPDSVNAVDIPMPEGTPIVAARDGIVMRTEESQTESGQRAELLSKANSVRIMHSDGSMAVYAHLTYKGVLVSPGQQVTAGQTIGLAGSTGFSTGPHLHFVILKLVQNENGFTSESIPFRFYVGNPAVAFAASYGMMAKADYQNPGQIPPVVVRTRVASPNAPLANLPTPQPMPQRSPYLP
jgi:murein DD-endopeptidase MepM/ murein hydrolase activator NlpD